jgi:methionine-rich copper-binding protein CopC
VARQPKFCYDAALPSPGKVASMTRRLSLAWLIAALAVPAPALAHAIIVESSPAVNATVAGPDVDVVLRFNSRIDRARSSVHLALSGTARGAEPAALELAPVDRPDILKTRAADLAPGAYTLRWQVLSVDGHITRGDIPFKVGR